MAGLIVTTGLAERFWSKVQRGCPDECWEWRGARSVDGGYGLVRMTKPTRRHARSHRVAWTLTSGPIPDGLFVCHHCDNPPCCNPKHLFLGTNNDNVQDMVRKGRQAFNLPLVKGAKLDAEKVRAIRATYDNGKARSRLAAMFGVTPGSIYRVAKGETWKHVSPGC